MTDELVQAARLHSTIGGDDPKRAAERCQAEERNHDTAQLHELAGELGQAAASRSREEHRETANRSGDPRERAATQLTRRATEHEETRDPCFEYRDPDPRRRAARPRV